MGNFRGTFCEGCRGEMDEVTINGVRYFYCSDCEPDFVEEMSGEAEEEE